MEKILLTGYYGFDNIGDEAVLEQVVSQLRAVMPQAQLTALTNAPEATAAFHGVEAVNRWKLPQTWSAMRKHDVLVLGGGSLLQDITGSRSLAFYLMQIKAALRAGRPVMLYAQGVGPLVEESNRRKLGKVVNKCALITVRDRESAQLLAACGVDSAKIIVTVDPVLAAAPPPRERERKIGIALRPWDSFSGERLQAVAQTADRLAVDGYQSEFLPFYEPGDREISAQVAALMHSPAQLPADRFDCRSMPQEISGLDLVVGMRLHSLVMAAASATAAVGLSYDPKVSSFCAAAAQPVLPVEAVTADELYRLCRETLDRREAEQQRLGQERRSWQITARANALLLAQLLHGQPLDWPQALDEAAGAFDE